VPAASSYKTPSLAQWILALGITGFCAGFFGPIAVNPDANQGPLVGIFITGPGGALAGLVLGVLFRVLPFTATLQWRALFSICIVFLLATLYFCLPQPEKRGEIIEARVARCIPPQELFSSGVARWERSIAAAPWAKVPADWKVRAQQIFNDEKGVVLEMAIERRADIYQHRRPWNRGKISITAWQPVSVTKNYFARDEGSDCARYLQHAVAQYYPQAERNTDNSWPPLNVPDFLDLPVLGPVPVDYRPQQ
jgi:hypothetical protein